MGFHICRRGFNMVIVVEPQSKPLVKVAFSWDTNQLTLWDTLLDYDRSSLAERLLAFGVVIGHEGAYICAELAPFERHPLVRRLLAAPQLFRSRRQRRVAFAGWWNRKEADFVSRCAHLIGKRRNQKYLLPTLTDLSGTPLPSVVKYTIDGGRLWKTVSSEDGRRRPLLDSSEYG